MSDWIEQMVRSWLTFLVLCLAGLWCHPVPDNGILYPDIMTEFLRLTTTRPTVATSTKRSVIESTLAEDEKAFETATAVETTTELVLVTNKPQTGKSTVEQKATITKPDKEMVLNEIQPPQMVVPVDSKQTTQVTVAAQHTIDLMPADNEFKQPQKVVFKSNLSQSLVTTERQPTDHPVTFKPTGQQSLGINQVQQQQMAGSTVVQQPNLVQTAASNGPQQQQQQQPSFSIQSFVAQQQMMQNPPVIQQQTVPNPFRTQPQMMQSPPMVQPQIMHNPFMVQQPMMVNPLFRPQFSAQTPLVNMKKMDPVTHRLVPASRSKHYYIRGGDGTPLKLIPLKAFKPFMLSNGIQSPAVKLPVQ